jgi:hypothetical protein
MLFGKNLTPWPLTLKINRVPDSSKDYVCTKFGQNPLKDIDSRLFTRMLRGKHLTRFSVYCVPGKFEYTTSNQCEFCPKKTYKPTTGNEACTDCISNKTTSGIGSTSASDCSVGLYQYV